MDQTQIYRDAITKALHECNRLQVAGESGKSISSGDVASVGDILHAALKLK